MGSSNVLGPGFTLMTSVLSLWMFSRTAACALVFSCVCWWLQDSNDKSSKIIVKKTAKSRCSSCVHFTPLLLPSVIFFFNPSITHRIGNGDSRHACLDLKLIRKLTDFIGTTRFPVHTIQSLFIIHKVDLCSSSAQLTVQG